MNPKSMLGVLVSTVLLGQSPSLTVYNGGFAAVRDKITLDLKSGVNQVVYSGATRMLEPESVILRDPTGKIALQVLEQNYRNDPVSQGLLLSLFEGQTIEFEVTRGSAVQTIRGKVIRSGYEPGGNITQPLIEVEGKLMFQLPGTPLFPSLPENTILKPQLNWQIRTTAAAKVQAELAYITNGLTWSADYNLVSEEGKDSGDLIGWVTVRNDSGKVFENARLQLMAGDVNKVQPQRYDMMKQARGVLMEAAAAPVVTEKAFDEFHLYTLQNPTTLLDKQAKQVEFVRAEKLQTKRIFVYNGSEGFAYPMEGLLTEPGYGTQSNKKVSIYREFQNSKENNLGVPLPKGRIRLYTREGAEGPLQFVGENNIDHTPQGERVRIFTGNAFDLVGERRQTNFTSSGRRATESFEIKVRNRKKTAAEVRVVEPLYRWSTWNVTQNSQAFSKLDARTIEFVVNLAPDEEKIVTYTVEYRW